MVRAIFYLHMLGWTPGAEGLMSRTRPPTISIAEFLEGRPQRHEKVLKSTKTSGEVELDAAAYQKTLDEVGRGVLRGPFDATSKLPFEEVALVPRRGIW